MALPGKPYLAPVPCEDCQGTGYSDWEHDDQHCDPVMLCGKMPSYYKAHEKCPTCEGKGWHQMGTYWKGRRMW